MSIFAFFAFSLVYNSICVQCLDLPSNYWVVQHATSSLTYWLVVLLSVVMALLPRFVSHADPDYTILQVFLTISRHLNLILHECTWFYILIVTF